MINRADKIIGATPKHNNEAVYTNYFEGKKQVVPYTIDEGNLVITKKEIQKAEEIKC